LQAPSPMMNKGLTEIETEENLFLFSLQRDRKEIPLTMFYMIQELRV
jgi:hypothetical protein